jgi:hypothetical protein
MIDRGGTVLIPLDETEQALERVRKDAFSFAKFKSTEMGKRHVVREDARDQQMFFVVPFEECQGEFEYLGPIVEEDGPPSSKPNTAVVG